jgi:hypothetical protein
VLAHSAVGPPLVGPDSLILLHRIHSCWLVKAARCVRLLLMLMLDTAACPLVLLGCMLHPDPRRFVITGAKSTRRCAQLHVSTVCYKQLCTPVSYIACYKQRRTPVVGWQLTTVVNCATWAPAHAVTPRLLSTSGVYTRKWATCAPPQCAHCRMHKNPKCNLPATDSACMAIQSWPVAIIKAIATTRRTEPATARLQPRR